MASLDADKGELVIEGSRRGESTNARQHCGAGHFSWVPFDTPAFLAENKW